MKILIIEVIPMSEKEEIEAIEERPGEEQSEIEPVESQRNDSKQTPKRQSAQLQMNEIVQQLGNEEEREPKVQQVRLTTAAIPAINNPVHFYKGHEKYNWDVQMLDATDCIQKIENKVGLDFPEFPSLNEVAIDIKSVNNLKGHLFYNLRIRDQKGEREVSRRYTQFALLRNKLAQLWPGLVFSTLPSKTLIGISQSDLIRSRSQYIIRFLRHLTEAVFYSDQTQQFLKDSPGFNLETYLNGISIPKSAQMFEKYKKVFAEQYQVSAKQEFLYRKDEVPAILDEYQGYFSKKKIDLSDHMAAVKRMADSKQKYFRAASRLNASLLADYQDTIYRWIYGEAFPQSPPSIIQRISLAQIRKSIRTEGPGQKPQNNAEGQGKQQAEARERKQSKQPQREQQEFKFGLYSSEAYKSRFEDTAALIHDYNASSWKLYDVLKFQLKEIDSVIGAIQQTKAVRRQISYLQRTVAINKEQMEALASNKTTLKTFFMEGNNEEKRAKLAAQNQALEEQLKDLQDFYCLLMVIIEKQLKHYHQQRASFYQKSLAKAFGDQLAIARSIMDFHIYEEQLFAKELSQRLNLLRENPQEEQTEQKLA